MGINVLDDDQVTERDLAHLRAAIEVATQGRSHGNHPFGAVLVNTLGERILSAENTVLTDRDPTGHAELNLVRLAGRSLIRDELGTCTLYASTEPCAMCATAMYWGGISRVVYGTSAAQLNAAAPPSAEHDTLDLPCRVVFAAGTRAIKVQGPLLEVEAWRVHEGFWR